MNAKTLILLIGCLASSTAFATSMGGARNAGGAGGKGGSSVAEQQQSQSQGQEQGNNQSTTINQSSKSSGNVPNVYAPSMTTSDSTCMGSISGGLSAIGFGLSMGTTYTDSACVRRLDAIAVATVMGDQETAKEIMCASAEVAAAYSRAGRPCKTAGPAVMTHAVRVVTNCGHPSLTPGGREMCLRRAGSM